MEVYQNKNLTIFVVNFNTTEMTNICLQRIIDHCKIYNYQIIVFDNSTTDKFILTINDDRIKVIDNTNNQVIDYDEFVKENCRGNDPGNYASAKHAYAIDWMINNCKTNNLLIIDSDAFLIKDIDFIDDKFSTVCEIGDSFGNKRVRPEIEYINVKVFRDNTLKFFDPHRFRYGLDMKYYLWDTGTCLLEDIIRKNLLFKEIKNSDYIKHLCGGSWRQIVNGNNFAFSRIDKFINENK